MGIIGMLGNAAIAGTRIRGAQVETQREVDAQNEEAGRLRRRDALQEALSAAELRKAQTPEQRTISLNGRSFPDTPEGQRAALAWRTQVDPPTPEQPRAPVRGTPEYQAMVAAEEEVATETEIRRRQALIDAGVQMAPGAASASESRAASNQERTRTFEEAEGNAAIWANSGRFKLDQLSMILRRQHNLSPGDANRIAANAMRQTMADQRTRDSLTGGGGGTSSVAERAAARSRSGQ